MALNPQDMQDLANMPLAPPPPGVTPNLVNPVNLAYRYYIAGSISTVLMLAFVFARLYARFWHLGKPWWDDFICVIATILTCIFTGAVVKFCIVGVGRHIWDIPLLNFPEFTFLAIFVAVFSAPTIGFTKLTLFLLYLRLFSVNVWVKRGAWAGIISIVIFYTVVGFLYMFEFNHQMITEMTYAIGVFGAITDVYMICLPIYPIVRLQLNLNKKLALLGIFLTGSLAAMMSIVGCVFRFQFNRHSQTPTEQDLSWELLNILLVVTVELDIGIICSCMPAASILFMQPASSAPATPYKSSSPNSDPELARRGTMLPLASHPNQLGYTEHDNDSSDGIEKDSSIQVVSD